VAERWAHAPAERRRFALLEKGEVLLLHNWCLHRSEVNRTPRARRGFSVCYIDAATSTRGALGEDSAPPAAVESCSHRPV
jgi:hypothetical protein